MAKPEDVKPAEDGPESDLFEIELRGIDREIYGDGTECFEVTFTCNRPNESVDASLTIDVERNPG